MARKQHRRRPRYELPGVGDCLGCGRSTVWGGAMLRARGSTSDGFYVLCEHCSAHYSSLRTTAAHDSFLDCLEEEFLRRIATQS
jgi:hypothetical protein